jgi:threonine dehydrogenase-like Zn-dependent dehydrogenase
MLIALCRHAGLRPIVSVEPNPKKRELALRMGADITIDPATEDVIEQATRAVGSNGYPYLIDAVGSTGVLATTIELAGRGAKILVFGVAAPTAVAPIHPNLIYSKELTILGSAINPFTHHRATALLGRLPLHTFETGMFELDDAPAALAAVRTGSYDKVQIRVRG